MRRILDWTEGITKLRRLAELIIMLVDKCEERDDYSTAYVTFKKSVLNCFMDDIYLFRETKGNIVRYEMGSSYSDEEEPKEFFSRKDLLKHLVSWMNTNPHTRIHFNELDCLAYEFFGPYFIDRYWMSHLYGYSVEDDLLQSPTRVDMDYTMSHKYACAFTTPRMWCINFRGDWMINFKNWREI
jgi:hypothetical protein